MNDKHDREKGLPWFWITLIGLPFAGLIVLAMLPTLRPDMPRVDASRTTWSHYSHQELGFSLDVPDAMKIEEGSEGIVLSVEGVGLVFVSFISESEADDRGLWGGRDPAANTQLGGVAGKKYVYDHFDALAGVHTIAYVVPWRDRFLALEFRTRRTSLFEELGLIHVSEDRELNEAELRMLESFRFNSVGFAD